MIPHWSTYTSIFLWKKIFSNCILKCVRVFLNQSYCVFRVEEPLSDCSAADEESNLTPGLEDFQLSGEENIQENQNPFKPWRMGIRLDGARDSERYLHRILHWRILVLVDNARNEKTSNKKLILKGHPFLELFTASAITLYTHVLLFVLL